MKTESPTPVPDISYRHLRSPAARRAIYFGPPERSVQANIFPSVKAKILHEKKLFTPDRNYLVRYGRDRVYCASLEDKTVVLICLLLPNLPCVPGFSSCLRNLKQLYYDSFSSRSVEFVLAVCVQHESRDYMHIETAFEEFLRPLPFLAIPFRDDEARLEVCVSSGIRHPKDNRKNSMQFTCSALDTEGNWMDFEPPYLFNYGPECYPFTKDKLACLHRDLASMRAAQVDLSMTSFLDCPSDDTAKLGLTKLDGTSVYLSPSDLCKGAGVFYLYGDGSRFEMLHQVYKDCKSQKLDLIVVLVYTPFKQDMDRGSYVEQVNKAMARFTQDDLYVLPLENDKLSRKMSRFFSCGDYSCPPDLLITWGPEDKCVDPDGAVLLNYYGLAAYPFTKVGFKASLMRKYEKLQLEDFLRSAKITYAGQEIALSQLKEIETIVLHISKAYDYDPNEIIDNSVLASFFDNDLPPGGFEWIFLCLGGETHGDVEAYLTAMPWLIAQFEDAADAEKLCKMGSELFYGDFAYIIIHKGKVVSRCTRTLFYSTLFSPDSDFVLPTDCTRVSVELAEAFENRHTGDHLFGRFR